MVAPVLSVLPAPRDAADALRDPRCPLHSLLQVSIVGIVVASQRDGRVRYVNDAMARMLGYTADELIGRTSRELDLYVLPAQQELLRAAIASDTAWELELALRHRDGHTVTVHVNGALAELGGEPCMLGYFQDVSELRRIDDARRATEAELATLFELAPVGLQEVEIATQRVLRVNAAICALTGYGADELLALRLPDYTHPDDVAQDAANFAAIRDGACTHGQLDKRYVRKDGEIRWVRVFFRIIDDGRGGPRRLMSAILDTTRSRADEVMRKLLTGALEATSNAVAITDTAGAMRWVNQAFTRLTGYAADEAIGENPRVLRSGVQGPAFYQAMWQCINAGETWRGELVNRRKDGSHYHEEMTITPVRDDAGAISHHIAIKQDITARKTIDHARHEAEERYRLALDASGLGTWQYDLERDLFTFGARAQSHFGLPANGSVGDLLRVIHPDDRDEIERTIAAAYAPGAPERSFAEYRVIHPGGEVRWLAVHAHITFAGAGAERHAVHTIGTTRDITERKRADEALRASEDRYRTLVDNLEDVVFSVDTSGRLTFVSQSVERFGYRPEDLVGRPMEDFIHPDDRTAMHADFAQRLTAVPAPPAELRWIDAGGKVRIMRASARPLVIGGVLVGLTGLATDVTAQRETEEQLRQVQRMEAIGRLAGGVAHDFNNLLSVITSYSELAMADLRDEDPLYADLSEIAEAAQRAAGLTRQLLAFSRRQLLQPEPVELGGLIAGMSKMLQRLIGEDVILHVAQPAKLGLTRVDRGQVEQVVMNLAVNARDAMPDGGHLTIECRNLTLDEAAAAPLELAPGAYVELEIADTGCGMTPEVQARIFEPFFTTKAVGKGTGLGLSMVHGIVKQSGGGIAVESAPGRGTTFRIYLPRLAGEVHEEPSAPLRITGRQPHGHERILVVEDEAALRSVTRRLLSAAGYHVDVAANAGEALLLCEERGHEVDLVLTDVVMPGMSGRKLAERLRALCPMAKVMFMSGYTDEMLAQHDVLEHAFIRKPFDRATLAAKVRSVLDGAA